MGSHALIFGITRSEGRIFRAWLHSTVELVDAREEFAFAVRFAGGRSRPYVLAADSQAALEGWDGGLFCLFVLLLFDMGPYVA